MVFVYTEHVQCSAFALRTEPKAARKYFWHAKGGLATLLRNQLKRPDLRSFWTLPDPLTTAATRMARSRGHTSESGLYDSWGWKTMIIDSGLFLVWRDEKTS